MYIVLCLGSQIWMKTARMLLGSALVLSLVYLFVQCAAGLTQQLVLNLSLRFLAESNHETAVRSTDDTLMRNYLRRFYENQLYVPRLQTSEIMAKRAAIPFSGGTKFIDHPNSHKLF